MEKKKKSRRARKIERLKKEVEEAKLNAKENYENYLRALADMDNFKKRMLKDKEEFLKYANERLVSSLIGVLDNFKRAVESANLSKEFEPFYEGIKLIYNQFQDTLKSEGLKEFSSLGEIFDPSRHEAMLTIESDKPPNTVVEEVEGGYILNDKVIRPAKVYVAKEKVEKEVSKNGESDRN